MSVLCASVPFSLRPPSTLLLLYVCASACLRRKMNQISWPSLPAARVEKRKTSRANTRIREGERAPVTAAARKKTTRWSIEETKSRGLADCVIFQEFDWGKGVEFREETSCCADLLFFFLSQTLISREEFLLQERWDEKNFRSGNEWHSRASCEAATFHYIYICVQSFSYILVSITEQIVKRSYTLWRSILYSCSSKRERERDTLYQRNRFFTPLHQKTTLTRARLKLRINLSPI